MYHVAVDCGGYTIKRFFYRDELTVVDEKLAETLKI